MQYEEKDIILLAKRASDALLETGCLLLSGPVGVGKTALARAVIHHLSPDVESVPSPSFPIMLPYDSSYGTLWHIDLYRLPAGEQCDAECRAMGLFDALQASLALIEWPEHLSCPPIGTWVYIDFVKNHPKKRTISFS